MDIKKRDFLAASISAGIGLSAPVATAQVAPAVNRDRAPGPGPVRVGDGGEPVNSGVQPSSVDLNYKPRRINKAIELWEDGQPIYYDSSGMGPGVDPYAQGVQMARTYMDAINVEMEHGALDFRAAARVHARPGGRRPDPQRPSHAGGIRRDLHHRSG